MSEKAEISKIEVIQAIQNEDSEVQLVIGKKTYARVYLDEIKSSFNREYRVTGKLKCAQTIGGVEPVMESLNSISIYTNEKGDLRGNRVDWTRSLNFDITDCLKRAGQDLELNLVELRLTCAQLTRAKTLQLAGEQYKLKISHRNISGSVQLYLTALVFRFWDSGIEDYVEPAPESVDLIKQFLTAAFPVAEDSINWNTIHVSASDSFRALAETQKYREDLDEVVSKELRKLLLQTMLHRNQDLYYDKDNGESEGRDIRTLYLGVFDDPSERLGGAAADSPDFEAHNIVGVTVVDLSGQTGCHELAHMLGRKHPGVPDRHKYGPQIGQRKEDKSPEVPKLGFLSSKPEECVGLHCDPRSAAPGVYEYNYWFDLMTYRYPQWVSKYTYEGLRERLNKLFINFQKSDYETASSKEWMVIGEYDLDRKSGEILYVLPTTYKTSQPEKSDITIDCRYVGKPDPTTIKVQHRRVADRDMPPFGIFQATVDTDGLEKIVLKIVDHEVETDPEIDTFSGLDSGNARILDEIYSLYKQFWDSPNSHDSVTRIENSRQYLKEHGGYIVFFYSVERDGYYLRYKWPKISTQAVTTIKCKKLDEEIWEAVVVTTRQKGLVWVSPNFIKQPTSDDETDDDRLSEAPYSFAKKKSRPVGDRLKDELTYKVIVTAGFKEYVFSPRNEQNPKIQFPKSSLRSVRERTKYLEELEQQDKAKFEIVKKRMNRSGRFRPLR